MTDPPRPAVDTPSRGPEEAAAQPVGNAFQDLAQPEVPSPGTYAATATPFEGGSHSILDITPSISGNPSQGLGPAPSQGVADAGYHSLAALDPAAEAQQQSQVRPALPCPGAAIV